ncbi:MAG TPA: hypothetical protein VIG30_08965 [Ktedonobacterales bacterium]|jgi:hypothetical protein
MTQVEALQAMLERQLIRGLAQAAAGAEDEAESQRQREALADLIAHADPTLDADLFDSVTRARLERLGLWVWTGPGGIAMPTRRPPRPAARATARGAGQSPA